MSAGSSEIAALPLFPLQAVLFPGGLLRLKVFEARYLDLVSRCLRERQPFGVVCLRQGPEVRQAATAAPVQFETIGVLADLREVDAEQSGILKVACLGGHRFEIGEPRRQADGLWLADATTLDDDDRVVPTPEFAPTVQALSRAIESLQTQGHRPFLEPYRLNDTGWVANRWCEILPIPLAARQKLMELGEPQRRLRLVADFLRGRGVV